MNNLNTIYAVVDLETTGSSFRKGNRIIQIGITMIQNDTIYEEYDFVVNPGMHIPPLIEKLTGITNQAVKDAPYFEDIASYVFNLLEGCVFVAHNIGFDYHFLNESFRAAGLSEMSIKGIDTVELSKILFPTLKSYRLSDLSVLFGFEHQNVHDAAGDANATAELFLHLKERATQLPLVTLEKILTLASHSQRDNHEFLEMCLYVALAEKTVLSNEITISNGIALRNKEVQNEQTAYRIKERLKLDTFLQADFLSKLGYKKRDLQQRIMQDSTKFFDEENKQSFAIEAPAGAGKTFGYLIPAILSATPDEKVVISTSTLLLQEQLEEEIKRIKTVFPIPFVYASLASKSHLLHLERFVELDYDTLSSTESLIIMSLYVWLTETESGDLSELSPSHRTGTLLERLSYQPGDTSISAKWAEHDFFQFHQQKAKQASILVTNHAYLAHHFEDIYQLSNEKKPRLIVDEAHRFPSVLQEIEKKTFSLSNVIKRVRKFSFDVRDYREHLENKATQPFPHYELINFEFALDQLHTTLSELEVRFIEELNEAGSELHSKKIEKKEHSLDTERIQGPGYQRSFYKIERHIEEVLVTGQRYWDISKTKENALFHDRTQAIQNELYRLKETITEIKQVIPYSYYYLKYETQANVFICEIIKGKWFIGDLFQEAILKHFDRVLYMSATLFLDGEITYFQEKIGATDIKAISYPEEVANLKQQLQILVPSDINPINEMENNDWIESIQLFIKKIAEENPHKVMVLFNSKQTLEKTYRKIRNELTYNEADVEILAQGFSGSRRRMHRRFKEADSAILLGGGMYWEGVDFADQPVEILVMTRLPFASPGTPEGKAIEHYYDSIGKNAFKEEYLPQMLIRLKQGIGRIARNESEAGVLICLDTRILNSSYAKVIKQALPVDVIINKQPMDKIFEILNDNK